MLSLPNIKVIGVTGMSGAGKSTVCREISQYCSLVIDCDSVAREVSHNLLFLNELQKRFGENVLNNDGTLNRSETARIIFSDTEKRSLYNQLIFPYIIYRVIQKIKSANGAVLLDAPTLFEAGLEIVCTTIVSVTADFEVCAKRISQRDGISPESARARLNSQHDERFFKEHSDYILVNNGDYDSLCCDVLDLVEKLSGEL